MSWGFPYDQCLIRYRFAYNSTNVLQDVSFSVDFSERVAILGGSGYGKTTILKLILGLIRPDSGRILIDGDDITGKTEEELRGAEDEIQHCFSGRSAL